MGFNKIYEMMPVFAQNIVCNIKGSQINRTRYSSSFDRLLDEFCERSSWGNDKICSYRDEKIRRLVVHCYDTVPYYQETFDKLGIRPEHITGLDSLPILPIIDKKTVISNYDKFMSSKALEYKLIHSHTSGTTGSGFKFVTTNHSIQAQWATFWRLYLNTGIARKERQGTFSGQMIVPTMQKKPPFWRYVDSQNRVYFSAYHEQEDNMKSYYDELIDSGITWVNGYPSLIAPLADYMVRNNLPNPGVKFVSTGAENLYDYQENQIKKAFKGAKFIQTYGQSENVSFFSQGANGDIWVDEDAAATEFIANENGSNDIIGTNLYNYAMPLLRYRVGDQAQYEIQKDGRRKVTKIDGRSEDYIYIPGGIKLGKLDSAFKDAMNVSESQIYQKKNYSVVIRVVLKSDKGKREANVAKKWLEEASDGKVPISIEYVNSIHRSKTHKLRYVISEIEDR